MDVMEANDFNYKLTNNICYEDRNENFNYTNDLMNQEYLTNLIGFVKSIYLFIYSSIYLFIY